MSNQPTVRRITDINPAENAIRKSARSILDLNASLAESCKVCPKPLWFTAFFDGTGNNYAIDEENKKRDSTDAQRTHYSNIAKLWQFAHAATTPTILYVPSQPISKA